MKTKSLLFKFLALTMAIALLSTSARAASGVLDLTFGVDGRVLANLGSSLDTGSGVALLSNGYIYLAGFADKTPIVGRYIGNGAVDTSFGVDGLVTPQTDIFSGSKIAAQADGKLLVAGVSADRFAVARYNYNGANLDTSFGVNGIAVIPSDYWGSRWTCNDIAVQPDGKIVVVGTETNQGNFINFVIARFNSNGTPDDSFVANGTLLIDKTNFPNNRYNYGRAVAIQPDGKIVMSGYMMDDDGKMQISLARLNADGSFDKTNFGTNGQGTVTAALPKFKHSAGAIALQADGKIIVAGSTENYVDNTYEDLALARFNGNGALDTTFGGTGIVITDFGAKEYGADIHLQADGKIMMVGTSSTTSASNLLLARYNQNGALDNTFGNNGKIISDLANSGAGIEIQPDGKVLAAGSADNGDAAMLRYSMSEPIVKTFKSIGAQDGWILESSEFSNAGGALNGLATTFNIGDDARDRQYRSILSFNTSSIPDTAVVSAAQLRIKRQGLVGTDPFTTHGDLLLNISNRAFNYNLALELIDFNTTVISATTQDKITADAYYWYAANLSRVNIGFVNKIGVTQFRLRFSKDDNDDLSADYMKFFSGNSIEANMPQLIVTYYVP